MVEEEKEEEKVPDPNAVRLKLGAKLMWGFVPEKRTAVVKVRQKTDYEKYMEKKQKLEEKKRLKESKKINGASNIFLDLGLGDDAEELDRAVAYDQLDQFAASLEGTTAHQNDTLADDHEGDEPQVSLLN